MHGGPIDERLHAMDIMEKYGWDFQQYQQRPLWFDALYEVKSKALEQYNKVKDQEAKDQANG